MRARNRVILCLFLAICGLAGCGRLLPIPDGPGKRITEIPAPQELLGIWQLTHESVTALKREGFKGELSGRHMFSLLPDGKCEVRAYDSYDVNFLPRYISATGTWSVEVEKKVVKYVVLTIRWADRSSHANLGVFDMRLAKDGGRLVFWSFMTDPDERMYYEFAKKKDT
jgi:hypothetical protein